MCKFKIGDVITPIERGTGFEQATVLGIYTETKGKVKSRKIYKLKVINGTATIPVSVEEIYQLANKK